MTPKKRGAFSLLELAIVLVIVGLVAGFAMQAVKTEDTCYAQTQVQERDIQTAIAAFANANGRLPKPAKRGALPTEVNKYGVEGGSGDYASSPAPDSVLTGALPFATLGLSNDLAGDCWGNKFTYMVTEAMTSTSGYAAATGGAIEVRSGTSSTISSSILLSNTAAYALISHGKSAKGATARAATGAPLANDCNTAGGDKGNCTDGKTVYISQVSDGTVAANFFDDVVSYSDKGGLQAGTQTGTLNCPNGTAPWSVGSYTCSANYGPMNDGISTTLNSTTAPGSVLLKCTNGIISQSNKDCGCFADGVTPANTAYCCNADTDGNGTCAMQCTIADGVTPPGAGYCCVNPDLDGNGVCGQQCTVANGLVPPDPGKCCLNPDTDGNGYCGQQCTVADGLVPPDPGKCCLNADTDGNGQCGQQCTVANGITPGPGQCCLNGDSDGNGVCGQQCTVADGATPSAGQCCLNGDSDGNGVCGQQCTVANGGTPAAGQCCISPDTDGNGQCGLQCTVADGVAPTAGKCCLNPDTDGNGQCGAQAASCTITAQCGTANDTCAVGTVSKRVFRNCASVLGEFSQRFWFCNHNGSSVGCSGPATGPNCFIADTPITLEDGSRKQVSELKAGDKVRGQSGINTVQRVAVHHDDQKIYGFNGGKKFVTGGHPFYTVHGWKAIDPSLTPKDGHAVKTTKLAVGDQLLLDDGSALTVTSIEAESSGEHALYNPVMDGDHTYYAANLLVHNKDEYGTCSVQLTDAGACAPGGFALTNTNGDPSQCCSGAANADAANSCTASNVCAPACVADGVSSGGNPATCCNGDLDGNGICGGTSGCGGDQGYCTGYTCYVQCNGLCGTCTNPYGNVSQAMMYGVGCDGSLCPRPCNADGQSAGGDPGTCCNGDTDGNGTCGFQCRADGQSSSGNPGLCCNGDSDANGTCGTQTTYCNTWPTASGGFLWLGTCTDGCNAGTCTCAATIRLQSPYMGQNCPPQQSMSSTFAAGAGGTGTTAPKCTGTTVNGTPYAGNCWLHGYESSRPVYGQ